MTFHLPDLQATCRLGHALAQAICTHGPVALLLDGPLGAGKTTLTRALVEALPGGHEAEVASPSFNLMNRYPTRPETVHIDLYRESGGMLGEELEDILDDPTILAVVEWAKRLPHPVEPAVHVTWQESSPKGRVVTLDGQGERGRRIVEAVHTFLAEAPA
ncbi:tRNA (adenosine(37)-N6)-threonylcarbamoyltransferase complex ATPase subunit type 1 TsaE [Thermodesulfomicrobium sp. WS]|uniref:tRNA (adenosine(37)-N6)-threonylcarbamoyltransferase complex ATPase subunit type 1 TsaE n=1 Tax=Thermodesulfomicrobium sp. WS TaxID=3004129 RepID=UPI00249204E3|nr:tRNA (adenosine(37)-N6)-threonylcarbamoyltransferase complex ATPase subunit type 1 TsaE [Thermodesulfomicrobium sp. WS]BDV01625.1 tRNA (adenosine(37)-N6)-threonylcarbamoyltransferase complex ATPase subunit type 1 TsaE [Thermodesulfomicrobium sp. WS]